MFLITSEFHAIIDFQSNAVQIECFSFNKASSEPLARLVMGSMGNGCFCRNGSSHRVCNAVIEAAS